MLTEKQNKVIKELFERYRTVIIDNESNLVSTANKCDYAHLLNLCNEVLLNAEKYPFDKLCRWLGFIQGVLCVQNIIDVDTEREYTRPILHSLHDAHVPTF